MENCVDDTVILTGDPIVAYLWKVSNCGPGCVPPQILDEDLMKTWYFNSREPDTICNEYDYSLHEDQLGNKTLDPSLASLQRTGDFNGIWTLWPSTSFGVPENYTIYLKASSASYSHAVKEINVQQCYLIRKVNGTGIDTDKLYDDDTLEGSQLYADMTAEFTPLTTTLCPITYHLETSTDGITFTDFNNSDQVYLSPDGKIYVNVTGPIDRTQYYLASYDTFGNVARIEIHIYVRICRKPINNGISSEQLFFDPNLGGIQLLANMTAKFSPEPTSDCPITYRIERSSDGVNFNNYNDSAFIYITDTN